MQSLFRTTWFATDNQFHIGSLFICFMQCLFFSAIIPSIAHIIGSYYLASIPLFAFVAFTFSSITHQFVFSSVSVDFLSSDKLPLQIHLPFSGAHIIEICSYFGCSLY